MTIIFKIASMTFLSGTFMFFMKGERFPLLVLQSLTYQGLLLLVMHSVVSCFEIGFPSLKGWTNVLQNISFPVAILISLLSWSLGIPVDYGGLSTFKNHFFHSLNSIYALLSIGLCEKNLKKNEVWQPLCFGLGYAVFQLVMQKLGQPALYPFLDWIDNPVLAAGVVIICAVLLPLIHLSLCKLSEKIW